MSKGLAVAVALAILAAATTLGAAPGAGADKRAAASPSASQNARSGDGCRSRSQSGDTYQFERIGACPEVRPGSDMLAAAAAKPESEPAEIRLAGRGFLFIGGSIASLASLDERLEAAGRPGVPSGFLTLGAGGQAVAGRLILGAEAAGMFQGAAEGRHGRQSLSAVTGFFDLGYILRSGEKTSLSVLLGIGAGITSLRLNAGRALSFDGILEQPGGRIRLAASGFLLRPALAVDIWPGRSLFFIGLRAAYTIAPGRTRWELGYDEAAGGPDARLTGPSLRLVAGFGSR